MHKPTITIIDNNEKVLAQYHMCTVIPNKKDIIQFNKIKYIIVFKVYDFDTNTIFITVDKL